MLKFTTLLDPSVNVFNGGPTDITLEVNRGPRFVVQGVAGGAQWQPVRAVEGVPGYNNGGPSTNEFGPGQNSVTIQVGRARSYTVFVTVPPIPVTSLQFYLLLRTSAIAEWFLSCDGTVYDSSFGKVQPPASVPEMVNDSESGGLVDHSAL
ncbi:MAG TPA: hypothetical protein VEK57_29555 [Thermoanaerobaculia bacterium]|nr:hypothetical protein [Thermoanaerobaculia bacterium]